MHIAGKMFVESLKNASPEVLKDFLTKGDDIIKAYNSENKYDQAHNPQDDKYQNIDQAWRGSLDNASRFTQNTEKSSNACDLSRIKEDLKLNHDPLLIINTLWQVVRIGALVHDLGHYPMSHLFEHAIEEYSASLENETESSNSQATQFVRSLNSRRELYDTVIKVETSSLIGTPTDLYTLESKSLPSKRRKEHEDNGLFLFRNLSASGALKQYESMIKDMTLAVLETTPHSEYNSDTLNVTTQTQCRRLSFLSFLHSFFDNSFIDSDRLDYTKRDPISSGSNIGSFDLKKIISSCVVVKYKGNLRLGHGHKSIPAIESFMAERYSLYAHLIYHHSVLRMNSVVKEILIKIFSYFDNVEHSTGDAIIGIIKDSHLFAIKPNGKDYCLFGNNNIDMGRYDESWLKTVFRSIWFVLDDAKDKNTLKDNRLHADLYLLIDTFLVRKVENLISVWKSPSDFYHSLDIDILSDNVFLIQNFNEGIKTFENAKALKQYNSFIRKWKKFFYEKNIILLECISKLPSFATNPLFVYRGELVEARSSVALNSLSIAATSTPVLALFLIGTSIKDQDFSDQIKLMCDELKEVIANT